MKSRWRFWFVLMSASLLLWGCGGGGSGNDNPFSGDGNNPPPDTQGANPEPDGRGELLASALLTSLTPAEIGAVFADYGYAFSSPVAVKVFKISYRTVDPFNNPVTASGALVVPDGLTAAAPLLSSQHATRAMEDAVASVLPPWGFDDLEGLLFASDGYVTVLPDYLGYGDSAQMFHPYLHADSYSAVVVDLLRAVKNFCRAQNIPLNGELFLEGYSEGGYATMALHKAIEEKYSTEFTVTASAPMAGPYDLSGTLQGILQQASSDSLFFAAPAFWAYDKAYALDSLDRIFAPAYAGQMDTLFDGTQDEVTIAASLTNVTADLFQGSFLQGYLGAGEAQLKELIAANDLYNWKPTAPVKMIHCVSDEIVPFANSQKAYGSFLSLGAQNVSLDARTYGNHLDCAENAVLDARNWFNSL